jgi:hypothetical protein
MGSVRVSPVAPRLRAGSDRDLARALHNQGDLLS